MTHGTDIYGATLIRLIKPKGIVVPTQSADRPIVGSVHAYVHGMAKDRRKKPPVFKRSDAERRVRQGERLSRLLRTLHCIMGPGRWDADALARELEVSPRTIHRIMQTLSMANVPWYFCKEDGAYRVQPGFRFAGLDDREKELSVTNPATLKVAVDTLLKDLSRTAESLRKFSEELSRNLGAS